MIRLRDYQQRAFSEVHRLWGSGVKSVCLVMPTGSGKTATAAEFAQHELTAGRRMVFSVHRRQLVDDVVKRFSSHLGSKNVGQWMAGEAPNPDRPAQVSIIQTLIARGVRPPADMIVIDEAHRVQSSLYRDLLSAYPNARLLGITATPERADRKPLGDVFQELVVGANYSELIAAGHLVDCRVCRYPAMAMKPGELANDPIKSWLRYGESSSTFAFWSSVTESREWCKKFNEAGIPSVAVDAESSDTERRSALAKFESGDILVLHNVNLLTEGIDIVRARVCLLGAQIQGTGGFLQRVGRVLRPFPGKPDAIVIDLVGATLLHGLPTSDREYSLDGVAITSNSVEPLRNCEKCGAVIAAALRVCSECGYERSVKERFDVQIYNHELESVYAGAATPVDARTAEYRRLRALAKSRGYSAEWIVTNYRRLFKAPPVLADFTEPEKREEFTKLVSHAKAKGWKVAAAAVRYRNIFGQYPPRNWS
jgi:DNA repair protein RadD